MAATGIFKMTGRRWAANLFRSLFRSRPMPSSSSNLAALAPGIAAAGALDQHDIEALAQQGVRTIINHRPDDEDAGQVPAAEARQIAEAYGIAYHHIPVTAASLAREDVDAFAAGLAGAAQPIRPQCRNVTRSPLLGALAP